MKSAVYRVFVLAKALLLCAAQISASDEQQARPDDASGFATQTKMGGAHLAHINTPHPPHVTTILINPFDFLVQLCGRTNRVLYCPLPGQQLEVMLYDSEGKLVPKTEEGARLGRAMNVDDELIDPHHRVIMNRVRDERTVNFNYGGFDMTLGRFDARQLFIIKKAGEYQLIAQARFFEKMEEKEFRPVFINADAVNITVSEQDVVTYSDKTGLKKLILSSLVLLSLAFAAYRIVKSWRRGSRKQSACYCI